jgi:hypothetical protein
MACILVVAPTMANNISTPNLIVYFNADEGYRMDVIWKFFSGQKRESYQGDYEYGLFALYVVDVCRLVLSRFIDFTPGMIVLFFRWLHLAFWVASLIVLWRLTIRHFGHIWQAVVVSLYLACIPAFPYFLSNLKPDPVVLFFMLVGIDYTLRIVDESSWKNVAISVLCASIALIVKFSGAFLLPAIVTAMFVARWHHSAVQSFPIIRNGWMVYICFGTMLIIFPLLAIMFYVRASTGKTWFAGYGLWGSLLYNRVAFVMIIGGICCIMLALLIVMLSKLKAFNRVMTAVQELNSYIFIVFTIFVIFTLALGFRWISQPHYFLITYSQLVPYAFAGSSASVIPKGLWASIIADAGGKIKELGPALVGLFILYIAIEAISTKRSLKEDVTGLFKRSVLMSFICPFLAFIFIAMTRAVQLHMLPFIVAMLLLVLQSGSIVSRVMRHRSRIRVAGIIVVCIFLSFDIARNAIATVTAVKTRYHQREDIVFEIMRWWRSNIPRAGCIVADHYIRVYIPDEYKNVKTLDWGQSDRLSELRRLVAAYQPRYIYYREDPADIDNISPLEAKLPNKRLKLMKVFESTGQRYQKNPRAKFFVYEVLN